jgi:hypothetical protein
MVVELEFRVLVGLLLVVFFLFLLPGVLLFRGCLAGLRRRRGRLWRREQHAKECGGQYQ